MAKECKTYIDSIDTLNFHKEQEDKIGGLDLTDNTANAPWMAKLLLKLGARGPDHRYNEKDLNKAIKDTFGKPDENKFLATKLLSIIEKNPGIEEIMRDHIMKQTTRLGDKVSLEWRQDEFGVRVPDFSTMPKNVLKGSINEAQRILRHGYGEKIGEGILGKFLLDLTTPKKMALKDASGALYAMRKATRDFATNQANRAARFLRADPTKSDYVTVENSKGKKSKQLRDYGMEDILSSITQLADHESLSRLKTPKTKIIINDMFTRYNVKDDLGNRWLKFRKGTPTPDDAYGSMLVATEYQPATMIDEKGELIQLKYKSTGDPIYKLSNYIPVEEYYGKNYVPFTEDMRKVFNKEAARYRALHKNVHDYMIEEGDLEREKMYSTIRSLFPKRLD